MKQTQYVLAIICALDIAITLTLIAQDTRPAGPRAVGGAPINFKSFTSPILFKGDEVTAYRDPAAIFDQGMFHLYFTLVKTEPDGTVFSYTAWSKSPDLKNWTSPKIFTPRNRSMNFSSPGNVVRFRGQWVLCLQTYPRLNGEKYGNKDSRIWMMQSKDLEKWGAPDLLRVKGPDVPQEMMGRMIDPYLVADKDEPDKWWCFYKQNGISLSWSRDLKTWTYLGAIPSGENPCVLVDRGEYILFHSPKNGIGIKRSPDLRSWRDAGKPITLGQKNWPWAAGRLTAGFVLDLRRQPEIGKFIMFFHGSKFPENDPRGGFDNFASIGFAWSNDLTNWEWPDEIGGE